MRTQIMLINKLIIVHIPLPIFFIIGIKNCSRIESIRNIFNNSNITYTFITRIGYIEIIIYRFPNIKPRSAVSFIINSMPVWRHISVYCLGNIELVINHKAISAFNRSVICITLVLCNNVICARCEYMVVCFIHFSVSVTHKKI